MADIQTADMLNLSTPEVVEHEVLKQEKSNAERYGKRVRRKSRRN
ncbi:MAG: hypothetical protein V8R51_05660 [Clostridia bacterium]